MKKIYLKALVPVLIFAGMQGIGGIAMLLFEESINALSATVILSGALTVAMLWRLGYIRKQAVVPFSLGQKWIWGVVAAASCIVATDLCSELMDFTDLMGKVFMRMSHTVLGVLAIAVSGPLVEELVFRESILGTLRKSGVGKWSSILFCALLFGLIHGNPIQIPFAFMVGIVFGLIYWKTGNVVLTSIIHIVNNSIAVVEMNVFGEQLYEFYFYNYIGVVTEVVIIFVMGAISLISCRKIL